MRREPKNKGYMKTDKELHKLENLIIAHPKMVEKLNLILERKGKETGQRFSTEIEELIIKILKETLGNRVSSPSESRAMYDVKIDNDIFNVKFGMEKMGSPNVVSVERLMNEIGNNHIDSYYLIKVKYVNNIFDLKIFDILDYLNYIPFATDKQAKIEESKFYKNYSPILDKSKLGFIEKKRILLEKYEDMYIRRSKKDIKNQNKTLNLFD
jgi:hypothetical protein